MRQVLLQNATVTLLQNAADITKCNCFIAKSNSFCKIRRYL